MPAERPDDRAPGRPALAPSTAHGDSPGAGSRRSGRPHRYTVIAVDPALRGMSHLADHLDGRACLPDRSALRHHVSSARRDLDQDAERALLGVVLPSTRPGLVLEALRLGVDRIALFHRGEGPSGRLGPTLLRAVLARVDLVVVVDADDERRAVVLGADPERVCRDPAAMSDRLFDEPRRTASGAGLVEMGTSLALDALEACGALGALERLTPDRGVNIVNYHRILPVAELTGYCRPQMALAAPIFEAQLETMSLRRGFVPVERLRDVAARDRVAITFDDGYEDNFRVALPLLERFSVPACVFVVTNLVGCPDALWWDRVGLALLAAWRQGVQRPIPAALPPRTRDLLEAGSFDAARRIVSDVLSELNLATTEAREDAARAAESLLTSPAASRTMLSWEELEGLARAGVVLGAHTRNHVPLDELEAEAAREELFGSQADLEGRVGLQVARVAALPRGRLGPLAEGDLTGGFDAVMTTEAGVNPTGEGRLFLKRRDGRMLTLAGRHHPAKVRLELTGVLDRLRSAYHARRGTPGA